MPPQPFLTAHVTPVNRQRPGLTIHLITIAIQESHDGAGGKIVRLNEDLKMSLVREGGRYETTLDQLSRQLSADVSKAEADLEKSRAAVQASLISTV